MKEQLIKLKHNEDGHIALWKFYSEKCSDNRNILLTHGTFSNRKVLRGITEYFVNNDFNCWVFEWRNHGGSSKSNEKFDFESIGHKDFQIVFNFLFEECKLEKIDCITHSGGGICLTIALITQSEYQKKINSVSMFACQAFGAAYSKKNLAQIFIGKYISKFIGQVPAQKIGGEENETYYLMKQWFNWNLKGEFKGKSGIDYKEKMKTIKIPILSIYGAGDKLIAPPIGCKRYLSAFENTSNKSLLCSIAEGFLENYNHSRILHSRNAKNEIYPFVLDWINKNNTAANKVQNDI